VELDLRRIDSYLQQIVTEVADLEKILALPDGQIVSDRAKLKSLKYSVIVIAEAMTGALQHLLAKKHSVAVDGYSDALKKSTQHKMDFLKFTKRSVSLSYAPPSIASRCTKKEKLNRCR
jgi:uncharacterized protein YutE (UPF0331/DUF86 family)